MGQFYCSKCRAHHNFDETLGCDHLKYVLEPKSLAKCLDFVSSASVYAYITQNTDQYLRDIQVFDVLGDKFSRSGIFDSPDAATRWMTEHSESMNHLLRRLQGDGAGEVDVLRQINGSIRGLLYETEFPTDASGHVASNTPGIDLQVVNRLSGEVVEKIQVKSNWTSDVSGLRSTVREFMNSAHYSPETTLAGPRELIDEAQRMGIPNRTLVMADSEANRASGERLIENIRNGDAAVSGSISFQGAVTRVGEGAVIGAAVTVGISAITNYIEFRQGEISGREAFHRIGVDSSRGALIGAALGGISLVFPPGLIGLGIGIVVGSQIRKIVDIAYGRGAYKQILQDLGASTASVSLTADGIGALDSSIGIMQLAQESSARDLTAFAQKSLHTDERIAHLEQLMKEREP